MGSSFYVSSVRGAPRPTQSALIVVPLPHFFPFLLSVNYSFDLQPSGSFPPLSPVLFHFFSTSSLTMKQSFKSAASCPGQTSPHSLDLTWTDPPRERGHCMKLDEEVKVKWKDGGNVFSLGVVFSSAHCDAKRSCWKLQSAWRLWMVCQMQRDVTVHQTKPMNRERVKAAELTGVYSQQHFTNLIQT